MYESDEEYISRLVGKLSEYCGLPIEVLNERLAKMKLDGWSTIRLLLGQIYLYPQATSDDVPERLQLVEKARVPRSSRRRSTRSKSAAAKATAKKTAAKLKLAVLDKN